MVITDFLERNARLYGNETALVEVNPSEERDKAITWREASLIEASPSNAPYRRDMTWKDFDRRANRVANFLLSRNVKRGTKVGILLLNCIEWLPIYFGGLKSGCIAVPLNFRYSSDEIKYCLDLADIEILVFGPEFITRMDPIQGDIPKVKLQLFVGSECPDYAENFMKLISFCSSNVPPVQLDEEDLAAIYFSSGTTGFPKAILHKHSALVHSCKCEQAHHGQTHDDVFLCIPPLYHTGAKMHWFGSLITGSKAVLLRGVKPEWILRTVTEEKCTIVWLLVPWAQDILDAIESGKIDLSHHLIDQWRLLHIGAQPVPPSLVHRWLRYFPNHQYDTNYGLSESLGPGCVHLGVENVHKVGAIGKAGYGWETKIIDENGKICAQTILRSKINAEQSSIEAMADAAVAGGMPRAQAYKFAAQAVLGSAKMVLETGLHPGELKDQVCSPGGTTIQGVRRLEQGSVRADIMDAVIAAYEKNYDLK